MSVLKSVPQGVRRIASIALIVVLVSACVWWFWFRGSETAASNTKYVTSAMEPTTLQDSISGSGNLVSTDSAEIRTAVSGKVEAVYVSNGDYVEKDQALYLLSNDTLNSNLQQAQVDQATAKNTYDRLVMQNGNAAGELKDAQLRIDQQQNALTTQQKSLDNLSIYAPDDGYITDVKVRAGDDLNANTSVFDFYSIEQENERDYQLSLQQAKANVESKLQDYEKLTITAEYAGQITDLSVQEGDTVRTNDLLFNLKEPDRLERTTDSSAALQIKQAQLNLDNAQADLDNLCVTAPATGMISDLSLRPGDKVTTSSNLAAINDNRQLIVNVNVTQSYINGVTRGNKADVMITNSARTYTGVVTEVAPTGSLNENNVVTYPVEITIDNDGTLLAGMSALVSISSSDATFKSVSSLRGLLANEVTKATTPSVSGEIVELRAQNGDWVLEGQVIAVLKNESVELAYEQAAENLKQLLQDEFRAPGLSTVQDVHVQNGDWVEEGQLLMSLRSDAVESAYLQAERDYQKLLNRETGNTDIRNKTAGTVDTIYVKAGDKVEKGQLLADLSSDDLGYQLDRAQTDLSQAQAQYDALQQNTSAGELELARLKLEQANLNLENSQKKVDDLVVRALISGNVTESKSVTVGDELEAMTKLCTVFDYSAFKMVINVDELEIPKVTIGTPAEVTVDAFSDRSYSASVVEISREGTVSSGGSGSTFPVTVKFSTEDPLRAGMTATAEMVLSQAESTFSVVKSAVRKEADGTKWVNLLVGEEVVTKQVETGIETTSMMEITAGLELGDLVITGIVDEAGTSITDGGMMVGRPAGS